MQPTPSGPLLAARTSLCDVRVREQLRDVWLEEALRKDKRWYLMLTPNTLFVSLSRLHLWRDSFEYHCTSDALLLD